MYFSIQINEDYCSDINTFWNLRKHYVQVQNRFKALAGQLRIQIRPDSKFRMRKLKLFVDTFVGWISSFWTSKGFREKETQDFCWRIFGVGTCRTHCSFFAEHETEKSGFSSTCKRDFMRWLFMPFACTYELSHIYATHSYRERDINTRARLRTRAHTPTMRNDRVKSPTLFRISATLRFPHSFHCHLLVVPVITRKPFIYLWNTFQDSILST